MNEKPNPNQNIFSRLTALSVEKEEHLHLCTALESIEIQNETPAELPNPKKLKSFSFKGWNDLSKMPWLDQCTNLEKIKISSSSLKELPSWIQNCTKLRELHISRCYLLELPDWIGTLRNLEVLDISQNKIRTLPRSVQSLHNLRALYASENKLTKVVFYLRNCSKLDHLEKICLPFF